MAAEKDKMQPSKKADSAAKQDGKTSTQQEKGKNEEVEISVKAPQAYYIMPRSNLNLEGLELNESFVPKIIKSVEEEPF